MQAYELLEQELAKWLGIPDVVVCNSGTSALILALESLQLKKGTEVICPDFSMIACPRAIVIAGLTPILVDCDDTLNLDVKILCSSITPSTKVILCVHTYGRRCDMVEIHKIAEEKNLYVVEDMAEIHGILPHPYTDVACFSFYRNKIVAGEEGGAVVFPRYSSRSLHQPYHTARVKSLRSLGFNAEHDFWHTPGGHNFRLANCLAEKILKSLERVDENLYVRREIEEAYTRLCPPSLRYVLPKHAHHVCWVYDIRVPGLTTATQYALVKALNEAQVAARFPFRPTYRQEEFRDCAKVVNGCSDRASREVIYLPVQPGTTTEESVVRAWEVIEEVLADSPIHTTDPNFQLQCP